MNTPHNPSACSTAALVHQLDDQTLRNGHALLDSTRAHEFSNWIDQQLGELEEMFRVYSTPRSVRRSLGR